MSEETMVDTPQEGENPFEEKETTEEETPSSSPDENNEETTETPAPEGEETKPEEDPDKDKPFHQHPRWKKREDEWKEKFNGQETRHQDDIKKLREEFGTKKEDNANDTKIPGWFGGEQEQWDAFRADRTKEIQAAEDRAVERLNTEKTKESDAIKEATAYMKTEIESIEGDATLNPTGGKIDTNKLLKFVVDNDLVDSKGKWNYKSGFRLMKSSATSKKPTDKKVIAGATTSEPAGEKEPVNYKTSKDFINKRPW